MYPFSDPNDSRKDPVNRMIHRLLKAKVIAAGKVVPAVWKTTHGLARTPSRYELKREAKGYAKLRLIEGLISELENIVS